MITAIISQTIGLRLWADLMSGIVSASTFVNPLVAGFSACFASRYTAPLGDRLHTSTRRSTAPLLLNFLGAFLPALTGFLLALGVLTVYAAAVGSYGAPSAVWLLKLASAMLVSCAFGYALGALTGSRWWTAPTSALTLLAGFLVITYRGAPDWIEQGYPLSVVIDDVFYRLIPLTTIGQTVLNVGISALLVLVVAGARLAGPRLPAASLWITGVGIALGIALMSLGDWRYAEFYDPEDTVCEGSSPQICVNRGYQAALPELVRVFSELNTKAADTELATDRLEQEGIGEDPNPGARSLYLYELDEGFANSSASDYLWEYGATEACWERGDRSEETIAVSVVNMWLSDYDEFGLAELGESAPGGLQYQRLNQLSPEQGNAWLREHIDAYFSCSLTLDDLP
ncbi:MAG: hypothetical protein ACK5LO_07275 [Leucobacter sp.]